MESITKTIMLEFDKLGLAGLYTARSGASAPITELLTLLLLAVPPPTGLNHCPALPCYSTFEHGVPLLICVHHLQHCQGR